MTKPRTLTISGPFDARHVGGVSIPGVSIPIAGIQRASTASGLQPDEPPSHTFAASGITEVPRRSNTIASTLRQPSLRLKTSLSLLRGRSSSYSPDRAPRKERGETPEPQVRHLHSEMPVQSLRKKPSTSRLWAKRMSHDTQAKDSAPKEKETTPKQKEVMPKKKEATPRQPPPPPTVPAPIETSMLSFTRKPSMLVRNASQSTANPREQYKSPYAYNPAPDSERVPPPPPPPKKQLSTVRLKRADSGVAVDSNNGSALERPLGFREIISVPSFEERMRLYKQTRDYWATTDHGLEDWVDSARVRRPVAARA